MPNKPDRTDLKDAHCWFPKTDRVSGHTEVTEFKVRARFQQAIWRERQGLPIGSHVIVRKNGSRIELEHATASGDNFLSDRIREAVRERLASPEPHQTLNKIRLWSDLLSSMPMCFNLFGELQGDHERLKKAVRVLWPGASGIADSIRFEWSPGRRNLAFLGDRTAFDAAIFLANMDGTRSVIGIETKYHEHILGEKAPHPEKRLPRYREITETSGIFKPGWEVAILGTELQQIWRDHLLVLSMLQHKDHSWSDGRYVLVHPAGNPSYPTAAERYRDLLRDDSTFEVRSMEQLLDAHVLHPRAVEQAFRDRYLWPE